MGRYRIPKGQTRVELRMSNSRFIATVTSAPTVKDAHAFIRSIRSEMPDATHHVYAFKVGYGASVSEGLTDDGEPSGTAGPPAMAVLRGADLGDTVLVITRYFGGTKLGTGGLVQAYSGAAKAVLEAIETEEKVERVRLEIEVPYKVLEQVRRVLPEYEAEVEDELFLADVRMRFHVPVERVDELTSALGDLTAGRVTPHLIE